MLSIVVVSRNDNHGKNMLKRMQYSIYTNIEIFEKLGIEVEYIVIDYNTDKKEKLKDLFTFKNSKFVKVKFIEIPPSFHEQFKDYEKLPVNNMVARNIGIRRAKGEFVLATGIDIIFSKELVKKMENLKKGFIYRANRYDVNRAILECKFKDGEEILKFCEKNIIDIHFNTNRGKFIPNTNIPMLHTNNCGDFQLAHRDIWFRLRGYPEIDLMGTHVDTLFEYMVYLSGIKEEVFEEKIYHIDHISRWLKPLYTHVLRSWRLLFKEFGYEVMKYKDDFYKLAKKVSQDAHEKAYLEEIDFRILSSDEYKQIIADMANGRRNVVYNNVNWGARGYNFKEVVFV